MEYKIRNKNTDSGVPLFWSNLFGWGDFRGATVFSEQEKQRLNLPLEGEWFPTTPKKILKPKVTHKTREEFNRIRSERKTTLVKFVDKYLNLALTKKTGQFCKISTSDLVKLERYIKKHESIS